MMRRPRSSTLVPYPPLFRSLVAFLRCAVDIRDVDVGAASAQGVLVTHATPGFVPAVAELVLGQMVDLARGISAADRKSTRLNSSHANISYAVFCLKKKKL